MELSNEQLQNFNNVDNLPIGIDQLVTSSNAPFITQLAVPSAFGAFQGTDLAKFPNDVVQLDIYNDQDFYYETIPAARDYSINGSDVYVDLESELVKAGYDAGDFKVNIRLLRNYLGSASTIKLLVQEISPDRQEIRVIPAKLAGSVESGSQAFANQANQAFSDLFSTNFFGFAKAQVLAGLYVFTDPITSFEVTDYVQDRFTINTVPYSIIFKLNEPLPTTTRVNDTVWVSQETNPATTETVYLVPQLKRSNLLRIKGPNYSITNKRVLGTNTEYKAWDDILSTNKTQTVRALLSESFVEGVPLNVDYTNFENFIKFSSAYERIKNFEYKVKLIESYQSISSSLAQSTSSGSIYIQTQMSGTLGKIDAVVGAFDGFERYMYFQSSSYVSNSFGEFLDMAWPKSTLTQPYTLYGSSTTKVETWLEGILASASIYDNSNPYNLQKLVPQHILEQDSDVVESFINMLGHFFDVQYEYISQFTTRYDRQEKLTEGFAKELVYNLAQNLGLDFSNGLNFQDLWSYTLGLDASGSYDNTLKLSGQDRTRELWKRIINNLPYLLKTKGTERGIRALINCFGIPSTILRVKEFSGPEIDFDKTSTYNHDRFYYALNVGAGSTTRSGSYIAVPWLSSGSTVGTSTTTAQAPVGLELRFKAAPFSGSIRRYNLAAWYSGSSTPVGPDWDPAGTFQNTYGIRLTNPWGTLDVGRDSGGDFIEYIGGTGNEFIVTSQSLKLYIPSSSNSQTLFDGDWITLYLRRTGSAVFGVGVSGSYELYAGKKTPYSEIPLIYSASVYYTGSFSDALGTEGYRNSRAFAYWGYTSSPNTFRWLLIGSSSIPGGFGFKTTASFSGSIQEVRFWNRFTAGGVNPSTGSTLVEPLGSNLQQSPFYAHTLSPTTIVGANYENQNWTGATSSFQDLNFRLPLGTDNKKTPLARSLSSYTSFIVTASGITTANQFSVNYNAPVLASGGFTTASWDPTLMTTSSNLANIPAGKDLYIYNMYNFGVNLNSSVATAVLNLFDAGYSVHTIGNDTLTQNVTGSGGTTWPILSASIFAANAQLSLSGSKATGTYGLPSNHPIGFGWTDWSDQDTDGGRWIDQLNTRPGPDTFVYPLAVSGGLQLTTTPETNTTAHMLGFYAVNTRTGGRWVHTQNRLYTHLYFSSSGIIPNQMINFLMREPNTEYASGSQPNQNSNWVAPTAFVGFSTNTSSHWTSVTETNYTPWPDLIGNRQTSNKIRIEDTINTSDQLYRNIKTQKSLQDTQPPDSPRLGIYLSPTDQVNEDIAEQFGGISLDDFIGDYSNVYENNYKDLDALKREYAKKSSAKSNPQAYIRLLQHFNGSLFSLVKQMVPYRANLQTGLVIEPHILDRSKVRVVNRPSSEDAYYESTLDATLSADLSGDTLDVVGAIEMPDQNINAVSVTQHEGSINGGTNITITGKQNEYNRDQIPAQGVDIDVESLEDTIDLNITANGNDKYSGTKYRYLTWVYSTGSTAYTGFVSNSAGFILTDSLPKPSWEPTGSVILNNRKSEVLLSINGVDLYGGTGSFTRDTGLVLSTNATTDANRDTTGALAKLGVRVMTESASVQSYYGWNLVGPYWELSSADFLSFTFTGSVGSVATGSVSLSAFGRGIDYFDTSFDVHKSATNYQATMSVWYGALTASTQPATTLNVTATSAATAHRFTQQIMASAVASSDVSMQINVTQDTATTTRGVRIDNVIVKAYKYAQIQDYHVGPLASIGLRNQKYDGCKLVASDYNEDSPDTIDKGPVITIIDGPAVDLKVDPNTNGTYIFR